MIVNFIKLFVCNDKFGSTSMDFNEVLYSIFGKSVDEIQFSLKYNKNNEYFT